MFRITGVMIGELWNVRYVEKMLNWAIMSMIRISGRIGGRMNMSKHMEVIESHECDVLDKYNNGLKKQQIAVQRLSDLHWYWVRWSNKQGNTADGIAYCPYCGAKLG